jgi:hypothetical protein
MLNFKWYKKLLGTINDRENKTLKTFKVFQL